MTTKSLREAARNFRPLLIVGKALSAWARQGGVQTTIQHSGKFRHAVGNVGIALTWMARGYQYDDRTFMQRMKAGNYYWAAAVRAIFANAVQS